MASSGTEGHHQRLRCIGTHVMIKVMLTDVKGSYTHALTAVQLVVSSSRRKKKRDTALSQGKPHVFSISVNLL